MSINKSLAHNKSREEYIIKATLANCLNPEKAQMLTEKIFDWLKEENRLWPNVKDIY